MKDTIIKLEAEIEELKKRLSAIFISHTTADQLKSITNYFDSVQTYLQNLTTSFNSHTKNFEEYSTKIENLESQIIDINTILNKLPNFDNFDADQINSKVENLTSKIETFETKFNSFIGENDTTLETILSDISSLQTDLGAMQEEIDSINIEISSINSDIGSMQTTITNLSSTQNSLSSAQNSMSANINSIDSRLTTAENNISVLTGGVDVSQIESKIINLEKELAFTNPFANKIIIKNKKSYNNKFYVPEQYFVSQKKGKIKVKYFLNFTSKSDHTITEKILINKNIFKTIEFMVKTGDNSQLIEIDFLPQYIHNSTKIEITTSGEINIEELKLEILGAGVHIFDYYKDLIVHCFDNKTFITKIEENTAYYDEFESSNVDLSSLTNTYNMSGEVSCVHFEYIPYIEANTTTQTFGNYVYATISDTPDGKRHLTPTGEIETSSTDLVAKDNISSYMYGSVNYTRTREPIMYVIHKNNYPAHFYAFSFSTSYEMYNFNSHVNGDWVYIKSITKNNNSVTSKYDEYRVVDTIALNEDGFFYYLPAMYVNYVVKLGVGTFATAYKHLDGVINVYISDFYKTNKYKLILNDNDMYDAIFIQTIEDCDCVYETYDNQIIKHNVSSDLWETSILEY